MKKVYLRVNVVLIYLINNLRFSYYASDAILHFHQKYDGISLFKSVKVNTIPLGENICWMNLASIVK